MSRGLNKVTAIGNLGKDPETKYMPSGFAVCKFPLACTETWKDKQSGETKEHTEWMNVEVWGKAAEACAEYLTKGQQVYVEGSLRTDKWEDKDGIERWSTKVKASNVLFLSSASGKREQSKAPEPAPKPKQEEFEDDIPF